MRRFLILMLLFVIGTSFVFAAGQQTRSEIRIGVALSSSDEFNMNLRRLYEDYARSVDGVSISFTHAISSTGQISDIENLVAQGINVLVIRALDQDIVTPAVLAAQARGIKIVVDEANVNGVEWDARITGAQIDHGIMLGEFLMGLINAGEIDRARIGYIAGSSTENALGRRNGIAQVLGPGRYEYMAGGAEGFELAEQWSATRAQVIVENWITSGLINNINVIACMNDEIANGAIAALGGRFPRIIVLGVDGSTVGQANIRNGTMRATTFQDSRLSARAVIDTCVALVRGTPVRFSDPVNKLVNPEHIALMTRETIDALIR